MCGIAGILSLNGAAAVDRQTLAAMANAIAHRGPDGEGFYVGTGVGLAHRRLAIIDLAGGKQPLANENGDLWVVFNGEIFNYQELRPPLEAKGHRFQTHSDTEVIVHLYEEYGPACVEKLRGQFAIALWDEKKRELFLARDRMGQKPLYLYQDRNHLAFASELKALFAVPGLSFQLDETVLGHYLRFGYLPAPRTQFREVTKLLPGEAIVVRDGELHRRIYWEMPFPTDEKKEIALPEAVAVLEEKLLEATRLRLIADVPLGAFLSGGLDSSLIVALMTVLHGGGVKTFNIAFREASFDESKYAKMVARHLGTEHHEIPVDYRIEELIEKVLAHFDEPFADSSAIPQYFVSQAARRFVKVALSGDAGDEFFFGYRRYFGRHLAEVYNRIPAPLRGWIKRSSRRLLPDNDEQISSSIAKMFQRFLLSTEFYTEKPQSSVLPFFGERDSRELLGDELHARQERHNPLAPLFEAHAGRNAICQMAYADQKSYFPDDILVKVDRMSMWHGLEVRSPLLDHPLVEWAAGLPLNMKVRHLRGKFILRKLAEKYLPPAILKRRKQGFAVPIPKWFRGELRDLVADRLLGSSSLFLQRTAIERIYKVHQSGERDWSQQLWALLALQATYRSPTRPRRQQFEATGSSAS